MKGFFIGVAVLIGFVGLGVVGTALNLITIPWLKLDRQIQMNRDIVAKTYNADNALYNYHWFKERAEAIKATENKVSIAKVSVVNFNTTVGLPRKEWTFEDKNEYARLNAVALGLQAQYEDLVAEYNAHAKEADRAVFQDELPLFFSLKPF